MINSATYLDVSVCLVRYVIGLYVSLVLFTFMRSDIDFISTLQDNFKSISVIELEVVTRGVGGDKRVAQPCERDLRRSSVHVRRETTKVLVSQSDVVHRYV